MVELLSLVRSIQERPSTKWLTHENVLSAELGLEGSESYTAVDELDTFVSSIENGGTGVRSNSTYRPNPKPFNVRTKLSDFKNNPVNLHYVKYTGFKGKHIELSEPSSLALCQPAKFYQTGRVKDGVATSLHDQLNIARWCMGTHQALSQPKYQDIGKRRRELVGHWVAGDPKGNLYQKLDLPILATVLSQYWDVYVSPDGSNLTETQCAAP
mmetsp:Transcript_18498/g.44528  ORF Transcript_18498/g.44528 Transcript_18498/m.44528 type:complete len:212 (-) Transcript_18498:238-873(-)